MILHESRQNTHHRIHPWSVQAPSRLYFLRRGWDLVNHLQTQRSSSSYTLVCQRCQIELPRPILDAEFVRLGTSIVIQRTWPPFLSGLVF